MHLPPPIHGAAMVGNFIKTSSLINQEIEALYINLATNTKLEQSGRAGFKKLLTFFSILANIFTILAKKRFDLCYISLTASGAGFYKDVLIVALLKISGVRIIYHFHNKGIADASKIWLNRVLYRFVFQNTRSILLSRFLYPEIQPYVKECDVFYCPNGIPDMEIFTDKIEVKSDSGKPCTFLFLSNMIEQKGVYILLEALKELKLRNLNFCCNFVGGWSDITEVKFNRRVEESGLSGYVYAHGPIYGKDKAKFWNQADVFVFPTFYFYEAFPLVNLEAMQHSLPIVSTPEGGIRDIVLDAETGFLVPQKDSQALADKLAILLLNPDLRKQMGIKGRQRFEIFFTLQQFEVRIVSILNDAAGMDN